MWEKTFRYIEKRIGEGDELTVLGEVTESKGANRPVLAYGMAGSPLVSDKGVGELTQGYTTSRNHNAIGAAVVGLVLVPAALVGLALCLAWSDENPRLVVMNNQPNAQPPIPWIDDEQPQRPPVGVQP